MMEIEPYEIFSNLWKKDAKFDLTILSWWTPRRDTGFLHTYKVA